MKKAFLKVIFAFACLISFYSHADAIKLSVTQPETQSYSNIITVPGQFVAKNEVSIGSPLQQQKVTSVLVEEGQWVEQGQLLATLESPIQSAAVLQLQAETEKARAYINQQSALANQAQRELERLKSLAHSGVIAVNDFEKARAEASAKKAELTASQAELRQLQAQLQREQSQKEKAQIIAPVAGVISERHAINGMLSDNSLLFKIIENNDIEFEANMHSSELSGLSHRHIVNVSTDFLPKLEGEVRFISAKINTATQLGKVRVSLKNNNGLHVGEVGVMTYTEQSQSKTTLPYSAIRTEADGTRNIFIVKQGTVEIQPVNIGKVQNGRVEILSEISPDIDVVVYAQAFLSEGDAVIPVKISIKDNQ